MTPGALPVTITDSAVTGHIWGDQIGWINLAPTGAGIFVSPATGVITGKAFATGGSWVNFNSTGQSVTLVDNGAGSNFFGWAWVSGPYGGWMKFDCLGTGTCIKTDWRILSKRESGSVSILPPNAGVIDTCPNIVGAQTSVPSGYILVAGLCVSQQIDACPYLSGMQTSTINCPIKPQNQNPVVSNNNQTEQDTGSQWQNSFDQNGDGEPDINPDINDGDNKKNEEPKITDEDGQYQKVFPVKTNKYVQEKPCFWCLLIRRDTSIDSIKNTLIERKVIKYGFVPKKMEIRIPLYKVPVGEQGNKFPLNKGVDATSIIITILALAGLRNFVLRLVARLVQL
jgi:hypothetical protein